MLKKKGVCVEVSNIFNTKQSQTLLIAMSIGSRGR